MQSEESNIKFFLMEYDKLKDEQHKRIEFRDHMIYLTLGAIGAIFSFSIEKPDYNIAFLILPFICCVLGWTYLVNDEKISAISKYIKLELLPKINKVDEQHVLTLSNNWEAFLSRDAKRKSRKRFQFIIDISIFCLSAFASIITFFLLHQNLHWYHFLIIIFESILISYLVFQFYRYADFK